jgi:hypothetical protein
VPSSSSRYAHWPATGNCPGGRQARPGRNESASPLAARGSPDLGRAMKASPPDLTAYVLLHLIRCADCQAPMAPATRSDTRLYRCIGSCRRDVDALHAETLL